MRSRNLRITSLVCAAASLVVLMATPAVAQEWTTGAPPGDDRKDVIGWIANDDGHILLMRWKEEKKVFWIFAELKLGNGKKFGTSVPGFQVDPRREIELDWQIGYGERHKKTLAEVKDTVAYWTMWWSKEKEISDGMMIGQWLDGHETLIIFALADGTVGNTRFQLAGLKDIIPQVSGITIEEEED